MAGTCPWYQRCGTDDGRGCGACDDGDPCTEDRCLFGYTCTSTPAPSCPCAPDCRDIEGRLVLVQSLGLGDGGLPGPLGPSDLVFTQDEAHVYVAAAGDEQVVHLGLQPDGGLRWGEVAAMGPSVVVELSGDERYLYAGGEHGLGLATRDPATGKVEPLGTFGPGAVALARSAKYLAAAQTDTLHLYAHPAEGDVAAPTLVGSTSDERLLGPSRMVFSPGGERIFVAAFDASGVAVVRAGADGPQIEGWASALPGLARPSDLALTADGARLYVAGFCARDVAVFDVDPVTGALQAAGTLLDAQHGDACARQEWEEYDHADLAALTLFNPTALALTPDGTQLAVSVLAPWYEVFYFPLPASGPTTATSWLSAEPPVREDFSALATIFTDSIPTRMLESPETFRSTGVLKTGPAHLFLANQLNNSVGAARSDSDASFIQRGAGGVTPPSGAYHLDLSPDDRFVYVAGRLFPTVSTFALDPQTGALSQVQNAPEPDWVRRDISGLTNIEVTPDGEAVVTVDADGGRVLTYHRDAASGALSFASVVEVPSCHGEIPLLVDITVAPDGRSALTANFQRETPSCLDVWTRDEDGTLRDPIQLDGDELRGIEAITFSADGRHVYAACLVAGTVVHYHRDPQTGELTHHSTEHSAAVEGVEFVVLSPDEETAYTSSPPADRFAVFDRDPDNGVLSHRQTVGINAAPLSSSAGVAVSPDGQRIYVAAREENAISLFGRLHDGRVELRDTLRDNAALDWVNGIHLTTDGSLLLAASVDNSAVSVLRVLPVDEGGCGGACPDAR